VIQSVTNRAYVARWTAVLTGINFDGASVDGAR
jgi:hypothetical protein